MTILITTSRRTNQRTRRLAKELSWVLPFSKKINRGHMSMDDLRRYMYIKGYSRLIIITSKKGNPHHINFLYPSYKQFEYHMSLEIRGLKLQLDANMHHMFNELETRYESGDYRIYEKLKEFIGDHVFDPSREIGNKGYLIIKENMESTIILFRDHKGKTIYPLLKVVYIENSTS